MFSDNSLLPKETIRLAALGILSEKPMIYADLANAVRQFVGRIAGSSLEMTGLSIELLRYEGLVYASEEGASAVLSLTETGHDELLTLLKATVRPPLTDMSKLVIALKMRFLPLLNDKERHDQVDLLIDSCELELARLSDLLEPSSEKLFFQDWLSHDIKLVENRLTWLQALRERSIRSYRRNKYRRDHNASRIAHKCPRLRTGQGYFDTTSTTFVSKIQISGLPASHLKTKYDGRILVLWREYTRAWHFTVCNDVNIKNAVFTLGVDRRSRISLYRLHSRNRDYIGSSACNLRRRAHPVQRDPRE